jgi:TonB family protein
LFFYFPPLWFVLVRLHWTAELACDEEAVVAGADSRELSRAIAHALRSGLSAPSPAAALGSARRSLLTERLNQLQSHRRYRSMRRHHGTVLFAALALAALLFAPKVERVSAADGVSPPPTASGRHAKSAAPTLEAEGAAGPSAAREREYSDFDVAPTPIADTMVMPTYPEEYRNVEATGRVLLRVRVSQEGVVSHIEELSGVDGYPEFTKAAEAAVSQWEFEPATLEGKPVTVDILIPIQFALD